MPSNINLFVYGSLREGFFNFDKYLQGKVVKITPATLKNMSLYHMPYKGYPAIIPGNDTIIGEIIEVIEYENTVEAIDYMEGFKGENNELNEYHKQLLTVNHIDSNKEEKCFVYFYNKNIDHKFNTEAVYISNGDWKDYMLKSEK